MSSCLSLFLLSSIQWLISEDKKVFVDKKSAKRKAKTGDNRCPPCSEKSSRQKLDLKKNGPASTLLEGCADHLKKLKTSLTLYEAKLHDKKKMPDFNGLFVRYDASEAGLPFFNWLLELGFMDLGNTEHPTMCLPTNEVRSEHKDMKEDRGVGVQEIW
mgnify:CR=1 FL=1